MNSTEILLITITACSLLCDIAIMWGMMRLKDEIDSLKNPSVKVAEINEAQKRVSFKEKAKDYAVVSDLINYSDSTDTVKNQ